LVGFFTVTSYEVLRTDGHVPIKAWTRGVPFEEGAKKQLRSHGAGRVMSRGEAKRRFTLDDHRAATEGVECRKDAAVLDETPAAYKSIDAVMKAQEDLVDVIHTLKQVVWLKR